MLTPMKLEDLPTNRPDLLASHRMLDANLNRCFEGLRTLEDIARFRDQSELQRRYKTLRHQLQAASSQWDSELLLASRNAHADVGRETKTASEALRSDGLADICEAAAQRVQQSLRCLEEVAKFLYPDSSAAIESTRYQAYDLNAMLLLSLQRDLQFLDQARLYVLAHCQMPIHAFQERVRDISRAGVSIIQIRDKRLDAQDLIRYTRAAIDAVDSRQTRIIVNDRADIVQCTDAWGLHVGQTDLSVSQSRSLMRANCVLGLSTHDVNQVKEAIASGVDYIGCGPTFRSATKQFDSYAGLDFLKEVSALIPNANSKLPAFAIGGVDLSNLSQLIDCGFRRVAVSKAVWESELPARAAESMLMKLNQVG